jgi:hypothetical protein
MSEQLPHESDFPGVKCKQFEHDVDAMLPLMVRNYCDVFPEYQNDGMVFRKEIGK